MKDEIKGIVRRMNNLIEHQFDKEYHTECDLFKDIQGLLDCITNLQEKLKVSQINEETYRLEMQDITKCLGLKEDTIFDEVKEYATNLQEENEKVRIQISAREEIIMNLQEENKRLKELCDKYEEEHSTRFNDWVFDKRENKRLKERCEYLEKQFEKR